MPQKTITITISEFEWMLAFMPHDEAKKMLEAHPVDGMEWCRYCSRFGMPHLHFQDSLLTSEKK